MDVPVNVPVDNPNADTEWNDILRKHGVIPEKPPSPTPIIEEAILEARQRAHDERLEDKDLDELAELEDEEEEEFLNKYRQKRLQELSHLSKASVYGHVYPLQKPDYSRDVTEASNGSYVLVLLTSALGSNIESRLLTELWREMARKYGDVKFCEIRGDMCIEGYPEKNCPTVLIYRNGEIIKQLITLKELRGQQTSQEDLEKLLVDIGAINPNDHRLSKTTNKDKIEDSRIRSKAGAEDNDDDDWD